MRRYGQLAKSVQQTMEMMRSGMAKNITAHSASMEVSKKTKATFKNLLRQFLDKLKIILLEK